MNNVNTKKEKKKKRPSKGQPLLHSSYMPAYIIELFYNLRAKLEAFLSEHPQKSIVVTSLEPAAGKSTISANMAISFAQKGLSTLLIDGDLRRGHLGSIFNLDTEKGLSDFLAGISIDPAHAGTDIHRSDLNSICYASGIPNLSLIPSGRSDKNPADLLSNPLRIEMIGSLFKEFNVVIMDTPPLEPLSDAFLVREFFSCYVLVVRAGKTNIKSLESKIKEYPALKEKIAGIVLNEAIEEQTKKNYYTYYLRDSKDTKVLS